MVNLKAHRQDRAVAFIAALLLVLQAIAASLAIGSSASASPMLDAFGNPLCITSHQAPEQDGQGHTALPHCCTVSCSMFAAAMDSGRAEVSLANPLPVADSSRHAAFDVAPEPNQAARRPGSPRSPPPTM
jgi:hypothetical protein